MEQDHRLSVLGQRYQTLFVANCWPPPPEGLLLCRSKATSTSQRRNNTRCAGEAAGPWYQQRRALPGLLIGPLIHAPSLHKVPRLREKKTGKRAGSRGSNICALAHALCLAHVPLSDP